MMVQHPRFMRPSSSRLLLVHMDLASLDEISVPSKSVPLRFAALPDCESTPNLAPLASAPDIGPRVATLQA